MHSDTDVLTRNWWALALRGAIAAVFGLYALAQPTTSFILLVAVFGAWWLADGALAIVAAVVAARRRERWWPLIAEGVTGIALGAALYLVPGITVRVLLGFVAAWALLTGAFRVVAAVRLRTIIDGEWLLGATGVLAIAFGLLVLASPETGAVALAVAIGVFALLYGLLMIILAVRLLMIGRERGTERQDGRPAHW